MNTTSTPDPKPIPHKAQDVARESDGTTQLVPYPGWLLIAARLDKKKGAA